MEAFLCVLAALAAPIFWIELGRVTIDFCGLKVSRRLISPDTSKVVQLVLGLEIFLVVVLLLKLVAMPWWIAVTIPLIPTLGRPRRLLRILRSMLPEPSVNFLIWFAVTLWSGLSLFQVSGAGIETSWMNNYGDLPFHLGMISSFVYGENFPPQYQIMAGESLSYPFLVNLWTASLWWIAPKIEMLPLIFMIQWVTVWTCVYYLLDGNRSPLVPWAVLLGGGSYWALGHNSGGEFIGKGISWTSFLTTIWVTQRGTLLGMICLLAAGSLARDRLNRVGHPRHGLETDETALLAGLILGLSPLAHTHFFVAGAIFLGACITVAAVQRYLHSHEPIEIVAPLGLFAVGLLPVVLSLPWLLGKSGIMKFTLGWSTTGNYAVPLTIDGIWDLIQSPMAKTSILSSLDLWIYHAPVLIFCLLTVAVFAPRRREGLILVALFFFANLVQMAVWEWDQIKLFIGIYLLTMLIFADYRGWRAVAAQAICLLLIIPGAYEAYSLFSEGPKHRIYSPEEVLTAERIRQTLPPDAVLANAPDHNHPVTLTGRRMYMGYEGTLSSHGLNYAGRREKMQDPDLFVTCAGDPNCPRFLVWTEREERYWKRQEPPFGWGRVTGAPVYKVPRPEL